MKFYYEGKTYELTFERHHQNVKVRKDGTLHTVRSTHPFTTAKLYECRMGELPLVVAMRTVGCNPQDKFTKERGRVESLRVLSRVLVKLGHPKGLVAAIWVAYKNRGQQPEQVGAVITSQPILLPGLIEGQIVH